MSGPIPTWRLRSRVGAELAPDDQPSVPDDPPPRCQLEGVRGRTQGAAGVVALALAVVACAPVSVAQARYAYVADAGSGEVSVIDTDTGQGVGQPIMTGGGTSSIALTPDGKFAFAANSSSEDVPVISTETDRVVGEPTDLSGYGHPNGVAISPDGKTA